MKTDVAKNSRPLKVLQIPSWYPPEGGAFCQKQALFLRQAGIHIDILANLQLPWRKHGLNALRFKRKPFVSKEGELLVYRYYQLRVPRCEKTNVNRWLSKTMQLADHYIKENGKPDIIHAHTSLWAGYAACLIKEKHQIPYVLTEHHSILGHPSLHTKKECKDWYDDYLFKSFSNADFILPVGSLQVERIKQYIRSGKANIQVLSNTIDVSLFSYKDRVRRKKFVFSAINDFAYYKAYDILLPAFDIVYENNPDIELHIAGDGFQSKAFKEIAGKCKHADKIKYLGCLSASEVRNQLWESDSLVLPSRSESQSISVLEALSTGIPVVCTEVVPPETVGSNEGYRVPIEDVNSLAEAMLRMEKTINQFDAGAISSHTQSKVNKESFVEKTKAIYRHVINEYQNDEQRISL